MNKRTFTILFTIISTLLNILFTLIVIAAMYGLLILVFKLFHLQNPTVLVVGLPACFMLGMILNIFLFARLSTWVIKKFNLAAKLDPRIVGKTLPNGTPNPYAEEEKKQKPKTVLPQSVLPKEEDRDVWAESIENGTYQPPQPQFPESESEPESAGMEDAKEASAEPEAPASFPEYQSFGLNELQRSRESNAAAAQALIKEREEEAAAYEAAKAARGSVPAPEQPAAAEPPAEEPPVSFGREELERLQKKSTE